jgi:hypothetical protein
MLSPECVVFSITLYVIAGFVDHKKAFLLAIIQKIAYNQRLKNKEAWLL